MPQPADINSPDTWICPVTATDFNGNPLSISSDVVNVAFVPKGQPAPAPGAGVWIACSWNSEVPTAVTIQFNQGAGSFVLKNLGAAGFYQGYVEVLDHPDQPILPMTDLLQITGVAA